VMDFSKAMKAVDPTIMIIPNGNNDKWWKTILTKDSGYIDAICLSNYPVYKLPDGYASYRDSVIDLMHPVRTALHAIDEYASLSDKATLKVIVAEYGPFDWGGKWPFTNTMAYNLANFELTGEELKEPRLDFSCFWNTRWIDNDEGRHSVFDALDRNGNFNANGYGLMIWGKFLGAQMVQTTSTTHLRTFASCSHDKKALFVYLVNKSADPIDVTLQMIGHDPAAIIQAWELTGTGPDDLSPVWRKVEDMDMDHPVNVKGTSIMVLEYQLK